MAEELTSIDSLEVPGSLNQIPTNREIPVGIVELEIKNFSTGYTKDADGSMNPKTGKPKVGGKLFVKCQVAVTDHPAHAAWRGITDFDTFYIGSDTDPKAKDFNTWKLNATGLMKLLKKAKVAMTPTTKIQDAMKAAIGSKFVGDVRVETSKDPKYPDKHRIKGYYAVGEKEPHVEMSEPDGDLNAAFAPASANGSASGFSEQD